MYSYYLAAAVLSKELVARISFVKQYITMIQMIQFAIILFYLAVHRLWYKCQYNDVFYSIFTVTVAIIFYTFYDFYRKSYVKDRRK